MRQDTRVQLQVMNNYIKSNLYIKSKDTPRLLISWEEIGWSIDSIGSFWGVDFDVLKRIKFGNLVDILSSSRRFDRVYQG